MWVFRFLPFALAAALLGQTAENAVPNPSAAIDQAVRGMGRMSLGLQPSVRLNWNQPNPAPPAEPPSRVAACAVPLLEVPIPNDTNFTIGRVPPLRTGDNMSSSRALPACSQR